MMGKAPNFKWMEEGAENPLDRSQALFEAALTEFAGHSYKEASLNEILKTAGMNKGSFYYRFRDKMELYLSLLYRVGMEKLHLFEEADLARVSSGFFDEFRNMALLGLKLAQKTCGILLFRGGYWKKSPRSGKRLPRRSATSATWYLPTWSTARRPPASSAAICRRTRRYL